DQHLADKSCCFRPDHLLDEVPGLVRARGNITSSSSCQFRRPRVFAPVFVLTAVPARFATTPQPPATAPTATLGRVAWTTLSSFSQLLPLTRWRRTHATKKSRGYAPGLRSSRLWSRNF